MLHLNIPSNKVLIGYGLSTYQTHSRFRGCLFYIIVKIFAHLDMHKRRFLHNKVYDSLGRTCNDEVVSIS